MLERVGCSIKNNLISMEKQSEFCFSKWSSILEKHSLDGEILELPEDVLNFILSEKQRIIIPKECYPEEEDSNESDEEENPPTFPEFSKRVQHIIDDVFSRRGVFVKTNFHSPKDAFWITTGRTLKIRDLTDFYQLIIASSIVRDDFETINKNKHIKPLFVFKEFLEIHPGTEFRCFVKNHKLIGISPKDWPEYHEHICQQAQDIRSDILTVFKEGIKNRFPLADHTFDVLRPSKENVQIIDLAPFSEETDSLAFEWDDLKSFEDEGKDVAEFRFIPSDVGIQPTKRNNYGVPQDVLDMFSGGSGESASEHFTDFMISQAQREQQ
ncbi:CDC123 family protein [Megaselia abdita]